MREADSIISRIIATAEAGNARKPEDYMGDDGLLHCGTCRKPKQCRVTDWLGSGTDKVLPSACECALEERRRFEERMKAEERRRTLDRMRRTGFPDAEMRKWTFAQDDGGNDRIMEVAHRYVDNFDSMRENGSGLLVYGDVGCGKSFMAACIANELIDRGTPCMMTNFTRIVNRLQERFDGRQKYIDNLNRFDLLVIDDLAAERDSDYMWEQVMAVIDARYRSGLPLIVTTNLTASELSDNEDMRKRRVYSRLKEMCIPLRMTGEDRRNGKMRQKMDVARGLLGL
jgi:DNA replication protein DnaC